MILRPYQTAAIEAVYKYLRENDDNPCIVIPTAGGKTPVLASICRDAVQLWNGRVLVLAHVKELLEQTASKLRMVCPELKFGIHSAGLKRRDTKEPVIVAGIQSVYQKACDLDAFDLVIVDECHFIAPDGEGMYRQFLKDSKIINPNVRVIGLTATPFRLKTGLICGPENILNSICYEIGVRELIRDGYLCPLVTKAGIARADMSDLHLRAGEFIADEVEALMDQDILVDAACAEIVEYTKDRNAVLIFTSGIVHGQHVVQVLRDQHGIECGFVTGDTPAAERDELIARFRGDPSDGLFERKPLKYLCNINVLTTGFDAPHVDCVVLLRPTASPGLYYQAVGRGFRLHPSKANCLVLDFGGNVLRHGPVDQIEVTTRAGNGDGPAPAKECPECHALIAAGYARCPECGHEFPEREKAKHEAEATDAGILSGQVTTNVFEVRDETYRVHTKRGAPEDAPKTMRVDYLIAIDFCQSEFICFEHQGYARRKAEAWWHARCDMPVPSTAEEAVRMANEGMLRQAKTITVRHVAGEKFPSIVGYELRVPELEPTPLEEIPF